MYISNLNLSNLKPYIFAKYTLNFKTHTHNHFTALLDFVQDYPGKVSMYKVMKSFICRGCVNPVTGTGCTSVDIGGDANLELVDNFCYLGDMLSVDGDVYAAVETRIRIGWNKFRQLVSWYCCLPIRIYHCL